MDWQPIANAPQDGTDVLIYGWFHRYGNPADIVYYTDVGHSTGNGVWVAGNLETSYRNVTHWMPLPAPPAQETEPS